LRNNTPSLNILEFLQGTESHVLLWMGNSHSREAKRGLSRYSGALNALIVDEKIKTKWRNV